MASRTASPSRTARIAGAFYVLNIVAGSLAAMSGAGRQSAGTAMLLVAAGAYVVVTILLYRLFKPVNATTSLVAAFFSLIGCALSMLGALHVSTPVDPLVFFGLYCLSIGYLIIRSTFLPRTLGVLIVIAGFSWLTFASPDLAHRLSPFNFLPGVIGEGALTLWLVVAGVNDQRWVEQAARVERA